jgi:hypothetical protein
MSTATSPNDAAAAKARAEEVARKAAEEAARKAVEEAARKAAEALKAAEAAKAAKEAQQQKENELTKQTQEKKAAEQAQQKAEQDQQRLALENEAGKQMVKEGKDPQVNNQAEMTARQAAVDDAKVDNELAQKKTVAETADVTKAQSDLDKAKSDTQVAEIKAKKIADDATLAQKAAEDANKKLETLKSQPPVNAQAPSLAPPPSTPNSQDVKAAPDAGNPVFNTIGNLWNAGSKAVGDAAVSTTNNVVGFTTNESFRDKVLSDAGNSIKNTADWTIKNPDKALINTVKATGEFVAGVGDAAWEAGKGTVQLATTAVIGTGGELIKIGARVVDAGLEKITGNYQINVDGSDWSKGNAYGTVWNANDKVLGDEGAKGLFKHGGAAVGLDNGFSGETFYGKGYKKSDKSGAYVGGEVAGTVASLFVAPEALVGKAAQATKLVKVVDAIADGKQALAQTNRAAKILEATNDAAKATDALRDAKAAVATTETTIAQAGTQTAAQTKTLQTAQNAADQATKKLEVVKAFSESAELGEKAAEPNSAPLGCCGW